MSQMRKSLAPYLPLTGVNYDSESLAVGQLDCLDISNLKLDSHELRTRPGLSQVGESTRFIQTETLNAAGCITLKAGSGWYITLDYAPSALVPVVLTMTDSGGSSWIMTEDLDDNLLYDATGLAVAAVVRGSSWVHFGAAGLYPWPSNTGPVTFVPSNPGGNTVFSFDYTRLTNYAYPFMSGEKVIRMAIHRDPDVGEVLFAFTDRGVYQYDDSAGDASASFSKVMDASLAAFSGITHWSTTEFTDSEIGATLIAAGSIPPPASDDDETDGTSRVLLYWDRATSTFKDLAPRYESTESLYTFTGAPETLPLAMGSAVLPPVDYASVSIWWYEGNYKWILTSTAAGALKDPLDVTCGSINLDTGAVSLTAWPTRTAGSYASTAGVAVTLEYESEIYLRPRFVFNMNNRLLFVNIFDREWDGVSAWEATGTYRPWRVAWSDIIDIFKHDITLSFTDNVGVDTSPYVAGEYISDMLILYRKSSIEQMFYVGGAGVFGFRTSVNHGLFSGNTVGTYKDLHFYMGKDTVYVYDGNTSKSIADQKIRDHILSVAKSDTLDKFSSFVDNSKGEYWLMVSTTSDTYPSRAYVYSINNAAWSVYNFPKNITTIQFRSEHFEKPLVATSDGYVLMLSEAQHVDEWEEWDADTEAWVSGDTAISVMLETRDFIIGEIEDLSRVQRVMFEAYSDAASGKAIDVSHSQDYGATYSATSAAALTNNPADAFYWIDTTERKIRFKIESDDYLVLRYLQLSGLGKEEK